MPINTANLIGRYAILPRNFYEHASNRSIIEAISEGFENHRLHEKKVASTNLDKAHTETEKLINITEGVQDNLITANTVFPFVLFRDSVSVDRQKLTIVHRSFFGTSSTTSVQIDDVQIAKVDVGPFFGSVHLASKYFVDNIQSINYLKRADAIAIQRLLQGYMIAHHRGIDCASIDNDQLVVLLNELGQGSTG
jgi:hypothetical protein